MSAKVKNIQDLQVEFANPVQFSHNIWDMLQPPQAMNWESS